MGYSVWGQLKKKFSNQIKFSIQKQGGGQNDVAALIGTFKGDNYNAATAALYFATADTGENIYSRMVIREDGKVGIGFTSPNFGLERRSVTGNLTDNQAFHGDFYIGRDGGYGWRLSTSTNNGGGTTTTESTTTTTSTDSSGETTSSTESSSSSGSDGSSSYGSSSYGGYYGY